MLRRADDEVIAISAIGSPVYNEGRFSGGFEFFRDISASKKLEKEKKALLSMIAHDMKYPVITSLGFLSRLLAEKRGPLTGPQRSCIELIRDEQLRLEKLINDFVELAKLEISENKPVYGPFSLENALHEKMDLILVGLLLVTFIFIMKTIYLLGQVIYKETNIPHVISEFLFIFILIEVMRILIIYIEFHHVSVDIMVELAIVAILREIMLKGAIELETIKMQAYPS